MACRHPLQRLRGSEASERRRIAARPRRAAPVRLAVAALAAEQVLGHLGEDDAVRLASLGQPVVAPLRAVRHLLRLGLLRRVLEALARLGQSLRKRDFAVSKRKRANRVGCAQLEPVGNFQARCVRIHDKSCHTIYLVMFCARKNSIKIRDVRI